ncbi:MAG TPA: serine/threonine-protein kinase, partial [Gemmatales bacterium]|nr:serine/threonine-protein kinase [Gemmatales bacterium]
LERLITRHYKDIGLPLARAAHYALQTALALEHAHEIGWVHRDIKPANILVDRYGNVKLLDLGLSRLFENDNDQLTRNFDEGNVLGTADYIAPEQALNVSAADIRADIYGLGCTLYFLLAGRPPFNKGSAAQKLLWHQTKYPEHIHTVRPDLPEEINEIIFRMIAKKPDDRFATPLEVAQALSPFVTEEVGPPPEEEVPWPSPMVKELLQTITPKQPVRTRRMTPIPFRATASSDAMRIPHIASPETDTLKDPASSKSPTKRNEITVVQGISRNAVIGIVLGAVLLTLLLTFLILWLVMGR